MKNYKDYLDYVKSIDREDIAQCADSAKQHAGAILERTMEKAHTFGVLDFAIFKLCLLSFGLWLGAQFSKFFGKFKLLIFAGFAASYAYLIWRIFFQDEK